MIPLMVDCTDRPVTIFGGGEVGARKAEYFAPAADVTVYSRTFSPAFQDIRVVQITTELTGDEREIDRYIEGAFLVIAATSDPDLNRRILTVCRDRKILCNNATMPRGDVILPATYEGGRFTIAISTKGASPAVSRFIREHLQAAFPDLDQLISLEEQLRSRLRDQGLPEPCRRDILTRALHDPEVRKRLQNGTDTTITYIMEQYPA